ncbi:hypothetical protein GBF38_012576 [Nibea albiflora]|uniref:Uncharacterized protein n=1 Tax=Nibea albiflora TaxID=240163 RepID=A0ACB7EIY7_NIBAL|nr:hypothetical protein GBF38_012576 [Nibea albiflora]
MDHARGEEIRWQFRCVTLGDEALQYVTSCNNRSCLRDETGMRRKDSEGWESVAVVLPVLYMHWLTISPCRQTAAVCGSNNRQKKEENEQRTGSGEAKKTDREK